MTHDPSRRLVSLEQVMNGSNPFELIDTPLGKMEKWRAETLLIGSTSGIQDVYRTIRDDAATKAARADEAEARNALIEHLCTKVVEFERRCGSNMVEHDAAGRSAAMHKVDPLAAQVGKSTKVHTNPHHPPPSARSASISAKMSA
jgi:hypothetical protein